MQTAERKLHFRDNFDLWIFSVCIHIYMRRRYKEFLFDKRVSKVIVIYGLQNKNS